MNPSFGTVLHSELLERIRALCISQHFASHIVERKAGHFHPDKFEDLRRCAEGIAAEKAEWREDRAAEGAGAIERGAWRRTSQARGVSRNATLWPVSARG